VVAVSKACRPASIADPETHNRNFEAKAVALSKDGARFLGHGGRYERLEGPAGARNVQQAVPCQWSPEHEAAPNLRLAFSTAHMAIEEAAE
jgi:uncharacterized protein (DUF1330 family)